MKKRIIVILLILVLFACAGLIYLNKVFLPEKIQSLIVSALEEATHKKVTLGSVRFSVFKGLVLRGLTVYEGKKALVGVKEASCSFLIPPLFKKKIVLHALRLESPFVFVERLPDNSFNLAPMLIRKESRKGEGGFSIIVNSVTISAGRIDFQDDALPVPFTKILDNVNAVFSFSLPSSIKFNLKCGVVSPAGTQAQISGNYDLINKRFTSKAFLKNLSLLEFAPYFRNTGASITQGSLDISTNLELKDGSVLAKATAKILELVILKDKIEAKASADITADIKYGMENKQLSFQGNADLAQSEILYYGFEPGLTNVSGRLSFDNNGISSQKISANFAGLPLEAGIKLSDFTNPVINVDIRGLNLEAVWKTAKDKFKLTVPVQIKGRAGLSVVAKKGVSQALPIQVNGYIDITEASLKPDKAAFSVEEISGKVEFTQNQLMWSGLKLKYLGVEYLLDGSLTDFAVPKINLALSSEKLSAKAQFIVEGKLIDIKELKGRYLDSEFLLNAKINISEAGITQTQSSGELGINLADIKEPLKKFREQLERAKPAGLVRVKFDLSGNISDFKSCLLDAEFSSHSLSAFGLKATDLVLSLKQERGILGIPSARLSLYEGIVNLSASLNLNSENLPFWVSLDAKDIKIEKLKTDTPASKKDIAGNLAAQVKLNGFSTDTSRLSGSGVIRVTEGKLWQLNLFQGLGKLIFARDFANIVLDEGHCGFIVGNEAVFTDSLKLKSNLAELDGTARIGFDGSVDASMRVHILDERAPLTSTLKDVVTAIIGQAGSFGLIKVSGTLSQPKFRFQPAVVDIINGLKESVFGNILGK